MGNLKIQSESLPTRCEICHQADQFDQEKNLCLRCSQLKRDSLPHQQSSSLISKIVEEKNSDDEMKMFRKCSLVIGTFTGLIGASLSYLIQFGMDLNSLWRDDLKFVFIGFILGSIVGCVLTGIIYISYPRLLSDTLIRKNKSGV